MGIFGGECVCGHDYDSHEYPGGPCGEGWCGCDYIEPDWPRDAPQNPGEEEFYRDNPRRWW